MLQGTEMVNCADAFTEQKLQQFTLHATKIANCKATFNNILQYHKKRYLTSGKKIYR